MKSRKNILLISTFVLLTACSHKVHQENTQQKQENAQEHLIYATLYHQHAAELEALCYMSYNMARMALDKDLKSSVLSKARAVVVDIDETVLDNSPYQAMCAIEGISYPTGWDEWCLLSEADAIPGSLEFMTYAKLKGVDIFYITNRKKNLMEATMRNLNRLGFPDADSTHLLMRTNNSNKEERRRMVERDHRIVLLIGDNLADFSEVYYNKSGEERTHLADSLKGDFGIHYIVLPNAMYGDWENVLYENKTDITPDEKGEIRKNKLKGFGSH